MNRTDQEQVRRKNKPILARSLMVGPAVVVILIMSCQFDYKVEPLAAATPAQRLALDATALFNFDNEVGPIDNMNEGLTLERVSEVAVRGFPTPSPKNISLLVLNHASEPIQFANVGFSIQVFEFHEATKAWHPFKLPYTPEQKVKIIPARLEEYDFNVLNGWDFSPDDLAGVTSNEIRVFVSGTGVLTKKKYGAFIDVML